MSIHSKLNELDEVDEADFSATTMFGNIDESNGSLNGRFDREIGFNVKSNRSLASVGRSHKTRRKDGGRRRSKSRSRRSDEDEMQVSQIILRIMKHKPKISSSKLKRSNGSFKMHYSLVVELHY